MSTFNIQHGACLLIDQSLTRMAKLCLTHLFLYCCGWWNIWQRFSLTFAIDTCMHMYLAACRRHESRYSWIDLSNLIIIPTFLQCLVLSLVYSKQPIFGLTQEWFRELSFSRLECGVHDSLHIYPLCGIFYFPWHRHRDSQSVM